MFFIVVVTVADQGTEITRHRTNTLDLDPEAGTGTGIENDQEEADQEIEAEDQGIMNQRAAKEVDLVKVKKTPVTRNQEVLQKKR